MSRDDSLPHPPISLRTVLAGGRRLGAVVSSYHGEIGMEMLDGARAELQLAGMAPYELLVLHAPGAFELPLIARALAMRDDIAAVLCFGVVLKGETSHDGYVAESAREGILRASLDTDKPILFGVLTCENEAQARARSLPKSRGGRLDKGREVARAAVLTLEALRQAASGGKGGASMGFGAPGAGAAPR